MATNNSFIPSAKDLVLVIPRLAQRAGAFAYNHLPEQAGAVLSKMRSGGDIIADATAINETGLLAAATTTEAFVQSTEVPVGSVASSASTGFLSWFRTGDSDSFRGFSAMFSYFGSRWALITFAMSILLNRTHFYASSRQNLELRWKTRLFLYATPITLLSIQALWALQAIRCQTSPDFSMMRYGNSTKQFSLNFGGEGGFLHKSSSLLLFWQDDAESCAAMNMSKSDDNMLGVRGSFSFIWPFFTTICLSQFVETLACALQGRQPRPETGMTMFEHSLAFAECEAMISTAFGLNTFNSGKHEAGGDGNTASTVDSVLLTRSMILNKLNVPPEVLLICLVSCLSHLSSAALAVLDRRHKYRLLNTTVWAFCYLAAFTWSFVRVLQNPFGTDADLGFLFFPTVCIIGFVPHILILFGITVCGSIYVLALLLNVMCPPPGAPETLTTYERFSLAFGNLQANVQFSASSSVRLNWHEDFYTNLLKVGFAILTAASEAVYLNESNRVAVHPMTWLERKRLQVLSSSRAAHTRHPENSREATVGGVRFSDQSLGDSISGYAKERKSQPRKSGGQRPKPSESGLGLADRRSRWALAGEFMDGLILLMVRIAAKSLIFALSLAGTSYRPTWLQRLAGSASPTKLRARTASAKPGTTREFWLVGPNGELRLPSDTLVDVEHETRQRMLSMSAATTDEAVEAKLYAWWKGGGWWGDIDASGDYAPLDDDDDDLTSIISASDVMDTGSDWESDEGSGRQTPTQDDPCPARSQQINMQDLARLLDPRTVEEREEAQVLSQHLQSDKILTRSRYRLRQAADRARILLPHATAVADVEADEEAALERFILAERQKASARACAQDDSWATGAAGMGASGPQCVVCQSAPRSILVWPCGCLSICDDCRVGVATRNFGSCLCCRTSVVAYSRLYVP